MQRPIRYVVDIRLRHIVTLHLVQNFFVDAHLVIGAVALVSVYAARRKAAEENYKDEGNRNAEDGALKAFGHVIRPTHVGRYMDDTPQRVFRVSVPGNALKLPFYRKKGSMYPLGQQFIRSIYLTTLQIIRVNG